MSEPHRFAFGIHNARGSIAWKQCRPLIRRGRGEKGTSQASEPIRDRWWVWLASSRN